MKIRNGWQKSLSESNLNSSLIRGVELKNPIFVDRPKKVSGSCQDGAGLTCKQKANLVLLMGKPTSARRAIEEKIGQVTSLQ